MEKLRNNITGIVKEFSTIDEDIEMLDTAGVVLKFNENTPSEAIEWICNLIQKPILSGGANLTLKKFAVDPSESTAEIFILSATLPQLFRAAQQYDLLKKTHDGVMKPFTYEDRQDFEHFEEDNDDFFLSAERQVLLKSMLDHVVCEDETVKHVPCYPKVKVYKGRPVLPRCVARKVIQIYPLHHYDTLKALKYQWYHEYTQFYQPIEKIKTYFGETIALYFSFLEFYTMYLVPPAIVGFLYFCFFPGVNTDNVVFAVLNVIWATIFLELWKRKGATIVYEWGRLKSSEVLRCECLNKMRRFILYFFLLSHLITSVICIYCFASTNEQSRSELLESVAAMVLGVLEIFWYSLLSVIFARSQWLNEPQAYLFIFMFITNCLRDGMIIVLWYGVKKICPYQTTIYYYYSPPKPDTYYVDPKHQVPYYVDQNIAPAFIMIFVLSAVFTLSLAVSCLTRLSLSCRGGNHHIPMLAKCAIIFISVAVSVLTVVSPTLQAFDDYMGYIDYPGLFIPSWFIIYCYVLMFFLLIGYSTRNQNDESFMLKYFVLWLMFVLYASMRLPFDVWGLPYCTGETDVYPNQKKVYSNVFAIASLQVQVFGSSIIPVILLFADINIRKTLLHYFPKTSCHLPCRNEGARNVEYGAIGTVVEDPALGAHEDDVHTKTGQTIENVFPEENPFKAPSKGIEDIETKAPHCAEHQRNV